MVNKSLLLTVDGKTYQITVPGPGMIAVDGNVFKIEMLPNGVKVNDKTVICSLSEDFAVVGGKLYDTSWKTVQDFSLLTLRLPNQPGKQN